MSKKILTIISFLLAICSMAMAEEMCLVTIKANGTTVNYSIPQVQKVVLNTESATPTFTVKLKDGRADDEGGKVIKFANAEPTEAIEADAEAVNVNAYASGKTIFVDADEECNIYFYNLAGQQLGDCVKASHCECTISLAGTYIVVAGGQRFKIQVQ